MIGKAAGEAADVVHHDVDGSEAIQRERLEVAKRVVRHYIAADAGCLSAGRLDLCGHCLGALRG